MKHPLHLTLIVLLICSLTTPQVQAIDYAQSLLFDSNTPKIILALAAVITFYFLMRTDEREWESRTKPIWGRIPEDPTKASPYHGRIAGYRYRYIRPKVSYTSPEYIVLDKWLDSYNLLRAYKQALLPIHKNLAPIKMLTEPSTQEELVNLLTKIQ